MALRIRQRDFGNRAGRSVVARRLVRLGIRGCETDKEFHPLSRRIGEPFKMMDLWQRCFGLRVSEMLALRRKDFDWMGGDILSSKVRRGVKFHFLLEDSMSPL